MFPEWPASSIRSKSGLEWQNESEKCSDSEVKAGIKNIKIKNKIFKIF